MLANGSKLKPHHLLVGMHVPSDVINSTAVKSVMFGYLRKVRFRLRFGKDMDLAGHKVFSHHRLLGVHYLLQTQGTFLLVHTVGCVFHKPPLKLVLRHKGKEFESKRAELEIGLCLMDEHEFEQPVFDNINARRVHVGPYLDVLALAD